MQDRRVACLSQTHLKQIRPLLAQRSSPDCTVHSMKIVNTLGIMLKRSTYDLMSLSEKRQQKRSEHLGKVIHHSDQFRLQLDCCKHHVANTVTMGEFMLYEMAKVAAQIATRMTAWFIAILLLLVRRYDDCTAHHSFIKLDSRKLVFQHGLKLRILRPAQISTIKRFEF